MSNLGSRKGHPQIWEGPIAIQMFVLIVNLGGVACRKLLHKFTSEINVLFNVRIDNIDIREGSIQA